MNRPSPADWLAALPDFLLAGTALLTWIAPTVLGVDKIGYFVLLMVFEFIVVHSAGFMGAVAFGKVSRAKRGLALLGFGALYTAVVAGVCIAFGKWWPLIAFWTLTLNRLAGALLGQAGDDDVKQFVWTGWAAGVVFYIFSAFATVLLPLPALGVTPAVIAAQHFSGRGAWIEEPWRAIAMAALYFGLQGWSTLNAHRWMARMKAGRAGKTDGVDAP